MNGLTRRATLGAATALALTQGVRAQAWPNKPIRILVPFPAGGIVDIVTRAVTDPMQADLGQTVVVEPKPGGNSTLATAMIPQLPADGYNLVMATISHVVVPHLQAVSYDALADFQPVALATVATSVATVNPALPVKTLKELVEHLKVNGDKVPGGTAGMGSGSHLGALAFFAATGVKYQLVPYRGTGPAMQDLMANQIQVMVDQSSNALPQVRAGKIRAYAVTAKVRSPAAPEIPTAAEAGYPMEVSIWHGLWAPKGTPPEIVARLNAAAVATLKDPEIRRRLEDLGQDLPSEAEMAPATFAAFHRDEYARWEKILVAANVKVE